MLLTDEEITRSIAWLCENASPPAKYLTHRHLLGASRRTKRVRDLWRAVESCTHAQEIFGKQRDDGSWHAGGSWANHPRIRGRLVRHPKADLGC